MPTPTRPDSEALPQEASADQIKILLVDDEPKNLTVLETVLADPAYHLVRANSADEALMALVSHEFGLIVLDIQMPGLSGFELAQMIKQRKKTASIPIIFLTAHYGEEQYVLEGYATGAVDYLQKPINPGILRSKVAVFTELYRKTREIEASNRALQAEVTERQRIEKQILQLNAELEDRVQERTSELLRMNQALRQSEERLRLAQQAGKTGIWEWDLRANHGFWTEAAWDIFDPQGFRGRVTTDKWLSCLHPADRERAAAALDESVTRGEYRDEYRVEQAQFGTKWVESIGAVEYDHGVPTRMRGVVHDVTERKTMELALKEADRRKDEFLAMLGHELRNPLASIRNTVSVMQHTPTGEIDWSWCHDVLDRQASQLTRLVDDLLDVSRISRGKIQLQQEVLDLRTVLQQAVEMCRPLIDERRHRLQVSLPAEPLTVCGDATRLKQSVANLLNNAAKYTDEGGSIWLTASRESGPEAFCSVCVRDTGRGLDESSIQHLFQMFYQVDHNLDRADGGLGVGLSLVRSLIELHGGTVAAHSPGRGKGSEFVIRLPCLGQSPESPEEPELQSTEIPPTRILVVDDNLDSAKSMALLLKLMGHDVCVAHDGREAVEVAVRERPQVIMLDIGLPGQDGYQACQLIRREGLDDELIVALTGYGQDEDRARSMAAGFNDHLVKPISLEMIQELLADYSQKRRRPR